MLLPGNTIASAGIHTPEEARSLAGEKAEGRVVAVGEILWDLLPAGPRLGGTTANFAIGCARLGRPAALVSSLGADPWGERARAELAARQTDGAGLLDTSLIQTAGGVPTGVVEVTVRPDGQPVYSTTTRTPKPPPPPSRLSDPRRPSVSAPFAKGTRSPVQPSGPW